MALQQKVEQIIACQDEMEFFRSLLLALGDQDRQVGMKAAEVLNKLAPDVLYAVSAEALAILQNHPPGTIFSSIAHMELADILGEIKYPSQEVFDLLLPMFDHPYWQVRVHAINALKKIRRSIPGSIIQQLLLWERGPDPRMRAVREAADDALSEILSLEAGEDE